MSQEEPAGEAASDVLVWADGPVLIRMANAVVTSDGSLLGGGRRVIALCRCGKSGLAPLCDGTHKKIVKRRGVADGRQND